MDHAFVIATIIRLLFFFDWRDIVKYPEIPNAKLPNRFQVLER